MPVDLEQIGPPKQYPPREPRLRVWLVVWVACLLVVDGAVLLLWPRNVPAQGATFWLLVAGLPNVLCIALVAWDRALYESRHLHVLHYNDHRERRRLELIREGQLFLKVLGYAYRLPLEHGAFANTVAQGKPLLKAQPLPDGATIVRHLRLPAEAEFDCADSRLLQVLQQSSLMREGKLYAQLLAPLVDRIGALIAAGVSPAIRLVIADDAPIEPALEQIRVVMRAFHLPALEHKAISGSDGLMPLDAWLDARESRPLLVMAAVTHDVPPEGSTEAGAALLLTPASLCLPPRINSCATIHRPVEKLGGHLGETVALGMLWGNAPPASVGHAWVTGFPEAQHTLIGEACRRTGLEGLINHASRHNPDVVIGYADVAAGWLAVTAAMEYGAECPQLVLNHARAMQAVIVRSHPVEA